jgi:dihydroorotate dehydrogenase (fumarate)
MPDLKTTYMGLSLSNPVIAGSSTQTITADRVKGLEDAGVGAVVLKSIFEEQIRSDVSEMVDSLQGDQHAEAYEYLRADYPMQIGPEKYLDRIRDIKAATSIPVIASVNCIDSDRWVTFAKKIEAAGADGLELNVYDIPQDGNVTAADVEQRHLDLIAAVCGEIKIPIAVKIGPFYSSIPHFVSRLTALDVKSIVMFNRFFQPDIDIDGLSLKSGINFSTPDDIRLPVRWIAMLRNCIKCDLSLTGGVHDAEGAIKAILAGANTVQICSALFKQGNACIPAILKGLEKWMGEKGFNTLDDFRGKLSDPAEGPRGEFARAQYVKAFVGME